MYEAKTKPTKMPVSAYLKAITDDERRRDCRTLSAMMKRITGHSPKMWGPSIVGFGKVHYEYASGHEGDMCEVGFSSRKGELSVYLLGGYIDPTTKKLLARLGKHRTGKACLYIKRLSDVQKDILEQLVARSVGYIRQRFSRSRS
jgi:hypothetical protein